MGTEARIACGPASGLASASTKLMLLLLAFLTLSLLANVSSSTCPMHTQLTSPIHGLKLHEAAKAPTSVTKDS